MFTFKNTNWTVAERSWKKLERAEVFSGGSGQLKKAFRRLMLLMELQNILLLNKCIDRELLGLFWTLSIVLYVEDKKIPQRFGDWICLCPQVDGAGQTYSVGPR
jgi:hypothetical protein